MNDVMRIMLMASFNEYLFEIMQKSIRPPSNSYIGRRFKMPKKSDELIKSDKKTLSLSQTEINSNTDNKFTKGPAKQRIISFL